MPTIRDIAEQIVAREGGYVNDPDDPGGATKHGVTLHTMRRLGLDLDHDGVVDTNDVRQLSHGKAVDIFLNHYFYRAKIDQLPEPLQSSVFDMNVNAGLQSIKLLQRMFVKMGYSLTMDGVIGPQTAGIAAEAMARAPDHLVDAYGIERRNYYYSLADNRPQSRKYARRQDGGKGGWIKRAEEFISAKYHLSLAEHKARVVAWG
ncbi:MAG: holin-associated N-acetylmuramidase [Pseudoruegeria sp.]